VTGALDLSREQILAYRRAAGGLEERVPITAGSLRRAAWAGLTDSVPRAALLSIHARVIGVTPSGWEDPSLVQVWGPRFSAYVVASQDRPVFTLGRLPTDPARRKFAEDLASRLDAFLAGRTMTYGEAGRALGVHPNMLRYAAPTGRVVIRWEGARQPTIRTVPKPEMDPHDARLELVRRYLHILGPGTGDAFCDWAGIRPARGRAMFDELQPENTPVRTPIGERWILTSDEPAFRTPAEPSRAVRLLPTGDAYYLLQGADRELVVPDATHRPELWTPRVWPGALLVNGEVVGTWSRAGAKVTLTAWVKLSKPAREAIEVEAKSLPLPGLPTTISVRWT